MANQGGSHEQHVKAGQQSRKTSDTKQAASHNERRSGDGASGRSREPQVKAGQQNHKKS
ncbi:MULTISPECIES: hypothetical protein [unclassified Rhizobium]|uniref:hypothetical protein n=1 Tax=unclassified Rhizobium TaxID=2613769 RepID=UPI003819F8DB